MKQRALLTVPFLALVLFACGGTARTQGEPTTSAGAGGVPSYGNAGGGTGGRIVSNGIAGEMDRSTRLGPGSWEMRGTVTVTGEVTYLKLDCPSVDFTLNITQFGAAAFRLTVGRDGQMDGTSEAYSSFKYAVSGAISLPSGSACHVNGLFAEDGFELLGQDLDGDLVADQITGTVMARANIAQGDVSATQDVQIELVGTPDVSKPALNVPETVNPLFPPTISASEPLSPEASLALLGMPKVPLTALRAHASSDPAPLNAVINFGTSTILPLSGSWTVDGTAHDLADHQLGPSGTLHTLADPGVFLQDGFESPLVGASESTGSSVVSGVGMIPAISGKQSLWMLPSSAVTFHLKRAASEKTVRLSMRSFASSGGGISTADIRAGVVGGTSVVSPTYAAPGPLVETGDTVWKQATPVTQITLPITDAGTDVLVNVATVSCYGFCAPPSALMVDDLILE